MRIGLYGMPTAGKTYILDKIDFMEVIVGSKLLRQYDPLFDQRDEAGREKDRKDVAELMMSKTEFIMDGHYAFGDEIAFTEEEGKMYEVYIYLYIDPSILRERMENSPKNQKYMKYDIESWQMKEIQGLREYCHKNNKDFYVVDNAPTNNNADANIVIEFIQSIRQGYSCYSLAKKISNSILKSAKEKDIYLFDGDKTLTIQDSSGAVLGYKTHLYDNNFYTGYHSWMQDKEFKNYKCPELKELPVEINEKILSKTRNQSFILTSGHKDIWQFISNQLEIPYFCGMAMSAETKYFITKILQENGKYVIAYGDGMNDYYMLKQADEGYLVTKPDGKISRSLKNVDLGGISIVRNK